MNLLVTGAYAWSEKQLNKLRTLGHDVVFMQYENSSLPCEAEWVEGVICNGLFLHHPIEKFENLKFIQLTSAGYDRVPMDYVEEHKIKIYNARGVYSIPLAEFALYEVLQLYKQSRFFFENQKEHKWEKHLELLELCGKTVCIIGCGSVGQECAKRFCAMGCNVFGADVYPVKSENFEEVLPMTKLDNLLTKADIVILTLPLTEETKHLFDKTKFQIMKNGALVVNISRGAVVNTNDLIVALNEKLGGAVLDVFEEEPLGENSPLWDMENVIITPHNSFVGEGNKERLWNIIKSNLEMYG